MSMQIEQSLCADMLPTCIFALCSSSAAGQDKVRNNLLLLLLLQDFLFSFFLLATASSSPPSTPPLLMPVPFVLLHFLLLQGRARAEMAKVDLLLVPTALHHYTVQEIQEEEQSADKVRLAWFYCRADGHR